MGTPVNTQLPLIAGQHCGVRVYCSQQAWPTWQQLVKQSRNANYWADFIVRSVTGLKSGAVSSKDVFVKTSAVHRGLQDFQIILPGCTVYAQREDNGTYIVCRIDASMDYQALSDKGKKPGLHRARKKDGNWQTRPTKFGKVSEAQGHKIIGISDRSSKRPPETSSLVGPRITKAINRRAEEGFDLFYTPGEGRFGGLLNYRQAIKADRDESLHESAVLLANTMKHARHMKDITWFSDFGGSAILTQAMKILNIHQVSLTNHTVFLHRPTSRKDLAYKLSQQLGMTVDGSFSKSDVTNINELIGGSSLSLPFLRSRNEEAYTGFHLLADLAKGATGGRTVWTSAMAVGALGTAAAAFPAMMTMAGAVKLAGAVAGAAPVIMSNMPDTTDRITARWS